MNSEDEQLKAARAKEQAVIDAARTWRKRTEENCHDYLLGEPTRRLLDAVRALDGEAGQ